MGRLSQFGVFLMVLGGIVLFLGLFPGAVDMDSTPGIGIAQMIGMMAGLLLLVAGAYVIARGLMPPNLGHSLLRDVGIRMGLTGMVFAAAATLADSMGFGSHSGGTGPLFGWLQTTGMLFGFVMAAAGVLIYGSART
jgi:hypothetical protein